MLSAKFNDSPNICPSGPDSDRVGKKYLQISLHCKIFVLEARNVTDIQNQKPTWLKPYQKKADTSKIYAEQSRCTSHYCATSYQCKVELVCEHCHYFLLYSFFF